MKKVQVEGIRINGTSIVVAKTEGKRLPSLAVMFDGDSNIYKVATFTGEDKARWFMDVMSEALLEEGEGC